MPLERRRLIRRADGNGEIQTPRGLGTKARRQNGCTVLPDERAGRIEPGGDPVSVFNDLPHERRRASPKALLAAVARGRKAWWPWRYWSAGGKGSTAGPAESPAPEAQTSFGGTLLWVDSNPVRAGAHDAGRNEKTVWVGVFGVDGKTYEI